MAVITRDKKCVSCNTDCINCRDTGKKRKWQPIPDELSLVRIELINDVLKTLERIKDLDVDYYEISDPDVDYCKIDDHIRELKGWLNDA
jgi:hypothetical protein